jgi:N-formylglutamate amidohydrolase
VKPPTYKSNALAHHEQVSQAEFLARRNAYFALPSRRRRSAEERLAAQFKPYAQQLDAAIARAKAGAL